jgi:DNA-binding NtrC family response regulator
MSDLIEKTILVVDDEDHVHESVNEMLLGSCENILHASDGLEASKITDTEKVDLIISDINMPEMDGLKLLGKIRWNHPNITVIIMSGAQKNIDNKGMIISQGYHFLKKPFKKDQLIGAICSTLSVTTSDA